MKQIIPPKIIPTPAILVIKPTIGKFLASEYLLRSSFTYENCLMYFKYILKKMPWIKNDINKRRPNAGTIPFSFINSFISCCMLSQIFSSLPKS